MRCPNKLWNDGAFFGAVAGCLGTLYVVYLCLVAPPPEFAWAVLGLPLAFVVVVVWASWFHSRQYLKSQTRRAERLKAREELSAESEVSAAEDLPEAVEIEDPYAGYMTCYRRLWRLQVEGREDCEAGSQLRERMALYWGRMSQDQRYKADVESGDAWKHAFDDEQGE